MESYNNCVIYGGVNPDDFWYLSHYDFTLFCYKIYHEKRIRDESLAQVASFIRNVYTVMVNQNRKKGQPAKKGSSLWPIPMVDKASGSPDISFIDRVKKHEEYLIKKGKLSPENIN